MNQVDTNESDATTEMVDDEPIIMKLPINVITNPSEFDIIYGWSEGFATVFQVLFIHLTNADWCVFIAVLKVIIYPTK